jgi:hypothetical protein
MCRTGVLLVIGGLDDALTIFDIASDRCLATIPVAADESFSIDDHSLGGDFLIFAGEFSQRVILRRIPSGEVLSVDSRVSENHRHTAHLSPDGRQFAHGYYRRKRAPQGVLEGVFDRIRALLLGQGTRAYEIHLYDVSDGRETMRFAGDDAVFSEDGAALLVNTFAMGQTTVEVYDVPFRGPRPQALVLGVFAGLSTYALAFRWSRSSRRRQAGPIRSASQGTL